VSPRRSNEAGFTLIEVLVSAIILIGGLLGLFTALNASSHLSTTVLRQQVATNEAEKAIEQVQARSFSGLWMATLPTATGDGILAGDTSGNPANPNYWVTGTNLKIAANFNSETGGTLAGVSLTGEPFVTAGSTGTGIAGATPTTFSDGGVTGSVYTYVTWVDENCAGTDPVTDAKRVTVAAVLNRTAGVGANKPVWLSTTVPNPSPTQC
jgi:type II secretory pathway pseudopilin PulG